MMKLFKNKFDKFRDGRLSSKQIPSIFREIQDNNLVEYEKEIADYLDSDDIYLRSRAIMILGLHWARKEYTHKFWDMLKNDSDNTCQYSAAIALGKIAKEYNDLSIIKDLVVFIQDKTRDNSIRIRAYQSVLEIFGMLPKDTTMFAVYDFDPETAIDWDFLKYIEKQNYKNINISRVKLPRTKAVGAQ